MVTVAVDPDDEALAQRLGWTTGVPGATVSILRVTTEEWITASTDSQGRAEFAGLLRGIYRVHAGRQLTASEAAGAGEPVRAFGDGTTTRIDALGDVPLTLSVASESPPGLVISEIGNWAPPPWETNGSYGEARYLEIYNNAGVPIALDGKVVGVTYYSGETVPTSCAMSQAIRSDPDGVYATQTVAFPGDGSDYEILPGETKLIAVSATDHTSIHPDLYDLSHADFEFRGAGSADNPQVPDMVDVGLVPFVQNGGGISVTPLTTTRWAYFIADPIQPQDLPIMFRDGTGRGWVRIPGGSLIDVAGLTLVWAEQERDFPPCSPMVHPDFDRYEGGFL